MTRFLRPVLAGSASLAAFVAAAPPVLAGDATRLPTITVEGTRAQRGSLTSPDIATQRGQVNRTPGSVSHIAAENSEAWFENRFLVLPQVAPTAGAKVFSSRRAFDGGLNLNTVPDAADMSATSSGVSPRIGILSEPVRDGQVLANITRSADVPGFSDLIQATATTAAFAPLRSQTGTTFGAGTCALRGRFNWEVAAYRAELRDRMLQFNVGPRIPASTFNAPRTRLRGLVTDGGRLTFREMLTWSDVRSVNDAVSGTNVLPLMPRHILRSSLTDARPAGFTVTPTVDIVPEGAFVDYRNTFRVPGHAVVDVQASARLPNGGEAVLDLRNLADKRRVADFGPVVLYNPAPTATFVPGTGRSLHGGARMQL